MKYLDMFLIESIFE